MKKIVAASAAVVILGISVGLFAHYNQKPPSDWKTYRLHTSPTICVSIPPDWTGRIDRYSDGNGDRVAPTSESDDSDPELPSMRGLAFSTTPRGNKKISDLFPPPYTQLKTSKDDVLRFYLDDGIVPSDNYVRTINETFLIGNASSLGYTEEDKIIPVMESAKKCE